MWCRIKRKTEASTRQPNNEQMVRSVFSIINVCVSFHCTEMEYDVLMHCFQATFASLQLSPLSAPEAGRLPKETTHNDFLWAVDSIPRTGRLVPQALAAQTCRRIADGMTPQIPATPNKQHLIIKDSSNQAFSFSLTLRGAEMKHRNGSWMTRQTVCTVLNIIFTK